MLCSEHESCISVSQFVFTRCDLVVAVCGSFMMLERLIFIFRTELESVAGVGGSYESNLQAGVERGKPDAVPC